MRILPSHPHAPLPQMTPRVVIVAGDWDKTDEIIDQFKQVLTEFPMLPAHYPGIHSRYAAFARTYPDAEAVDAPMLEGADGFGQPLPWLVNILEKLPEDPQVGGVSALFLVLVFVYMGGWGLWDGPTVHSRVHACMCLHT